MHDDAGHPIRVVGVHADITERKLAEAVLRDEIEARGRVERALRASEERCAKAFRTSPDAISIERRSDGQFIEVNERWVSLLGFTRRRPLDTPATSEDRGVRGRRRIWTPCSRCTGVSATSSWMSATVEERSSESSLHAIQ